MRRIGEYFKFYEKLGRIRFEYAENRPLAANRDFKPLR
jgi:hypothetical protein